MNEVKTIKELKQILLENGMTIENTAYKGRYKVTSKDGLLWKTVRFSNAKSCSYATVNVLDYDIEGNERWLPMYIEAFLKDTTL